MTTKQISALAGECYREYVAQYGDNPSPFLLEKEDRHQNSWPADTLLCDKLFVYRPEIRDFLGRKNLRLGPDTRYSFARAFFKARGLAVTSVRRFSEGDYREPPEAEHFPPPDPEKLDAFFWFEKYARAVTLANSTVERWRPAIKAFTKFLNHSDLAKVTKTNMRDWKEALLEGEVRVGKRVRKRSPRTIRDVYIAAVKALFQYLVDELRLPENPAAFVKVHNVETEKDDDEKGFSDKDAHTILVATLEPRSPKMWIEMAAARRWIPWICPYTGARVNEITSLNPDDIAEVEGILCFRLPKERTKSRKKRNVPVHSHLIEEGFLAYVEMRKKLRKPLFYDPVRSRGEPGSHPHYQKVGERLAEWIRTLPVDHNVAPNHGWRHRWKAQSRDIGMHGQIADFIQGHGKGTVSGRYGKKWPKTLKKAVETIPRYKIKRPVAAGQLRWNLNRQSDVERVIV
jgi:integrase